MTTEDTESDQAQAARRASLAADYRAARIASGLLLVLLVVFMVVFDAISRDFEVSPLVLVPILAVAAAFFAVDVPAVRK